MLLASIISEVIELTVLIEVYLLLNFKIFLFQSNIAHYKYFQRIFPFVQLMLIYVQDNRIILKFFCKMGLKFVGVRLVYRTTLNARVKIQCCYTTVIHSVT